MKNKKRSAKSKELNRLKRQIKRMELRGYRFAESFKESLSKLSWQKLRTITTRKLYSLSSALSEKGEIISGFKKRIEERRAAGIKAAETRKKKALSKQRAISIVDVIYQNIMDLIDSYPGRGADNLRKEIEWEIKTYGKEAVMKAMSEAPQELIKLAQDIVYYEDNRNALHDAYLAFHSIITGIIDGDESKKDIEEFLSNDAQLSDIYED